MTKLSDFRADSWAAIASCVDRGEHPLESDIVAALRRQEPAIPGTAQLYIARLLLGEGIDRRGRRKIELPSRFMKASMRVGRIHELEQTYRAQGCRDPQTKAFEQVARETRRGIGAVKQEYYRATKALTDLTRPRKVTSNKSFDDI